MCTGRCEGEVTPPSASVECEATAKAQASLEVECTPPSIDVSYAFSADASADVRAEFQAFLVRFRTSFGAIRAELERADVIIAAGSDLGAAADGAVSAAVDTAISGEASLKAQIGLGCALGQLENVGKVITDSTARLNDSVSVAGDLSLTLIGS
jgi:hypothetical protein